MTLEKFFEIKRTWFGGRRLSSKPKWLLANFGEADSRPAINFKKILIRGSSSSMSALFIHVNFFNRLDRAAKNRSFDFAMKMRC